MGRVRRKLAAAEGAARSRDDPDRRCMLCERPIGRHVEWHHAVPRSRGGEAVVPVHPICHRTIHATFTNVELATAYCSGEALRAHPAIARFVAWIADKPADFHAPTRRVR